ncbi:ATP synthase F1 subunit epsilon [Buchnera aphidicola (Taiwanaphis decaspermi)]|uniref:ATP synthase F1 subunit epsilon n=1 Tax=Buchnera aphidicola TaxID=9 RepID=UPI0031B868D3
MLIHLEIVSMQKRIFSGNVKNISTSGFYGELGIYPGHTQLLTAIKPGFVKFLNKNNKYNIFYISGGILEVQPNYVSVLGDFIIKSNKLNYKKILKKKKKLEIKIIKNKYSKNIKKKILKLKAKIKVINMIHN